MKTYDKHTEEQIGKDALRVAAGRRSLLRGPYGLERPNPEALKIASDLLPDNLQLQDDGWGICFCCAEVSMDYVEPDARGYRCACCGKPAVVGALEALMECE